MSDWITRERKTILDHNKFLKVENHVIELPDGTVIDDWAWVVLPSYTNTVIQTETGAYLLFKQTKYGIEGDSLALPGGYMEAGESPLEAAQREVREETGYEADSWALLGTYRVDANRGAGMAHLFLARNARKVTEIYADDLEPQTQVFLSRQALQQALMNGEIKVLAWAMGVSMALLWS